MKNGGIALPVGGTDGDSSANKAAFADQNMTSGRELSPNEISVIRERFHGREQATAKTLAAVFGVSVQRITAIVHSNRPEEFN